MSILDEQYLVDKLISQVFEYDTGLIIATIFNENGYRLIDRVENKITHLKKSTSNKGSTQDTDAHSEETNAGCTDIKPLPGYHVYNFPYLITRT